MQRESDTEPAAGPLRLPACDDPKHCHCLRYCNLFGPPWEFTRPVAADATPRERLEASIWFDLLTDETVAAFRGRENLLVPPRSEKPTLDEIAAIENLVDRARAIDANSQYRPCDPLRLLRDDPQHRPCEPWDPSPCEPWRILVESVKDTFPVGFAVQSYLSPLPEPGPKIYPWWYTPYRPYRPPAWRAYCPNLFDAFAEGPDPDCLRLASRIEREKRLDKMCERERDK